MDLWIRVRVRSRFTLNRRRDGWIRQAWEAFTPGDIAQRPPPDQRSGGAEEDQLARIDPGGAMLFLFCFSKVSDETRWWRRIGLPPSPPSLDQIKSRSTSTNCSPSFSFSAHRQRRMPGFERVTHEEHGHRRRGRTAAAAARRWRVERDAGTVGRGRERDAQ
jgi:hypothetical protein